MVNLAKTSLILAVTLNFTLAITGQMLGINPDVVLIVTSLLSAYLLFQIYRIYFYDDTSIESTFFSVDRVRTVRFAFGYFLIVSLLTALLVVSLPISLAALAALLAITIITILNILVGILGLIQSIFGGGFLGFLDYSFVEEVFFVVLGVFEIFYNLGSDTLIFIVLSTVIIFSIIMASYYTGKYIEDTSTALGISLFYSQLIFTPFIVFTLIEYQTSSSSGSPFESYYPTPLVIINLIPILSYYTMNLVFNSKDDETYELPELSSWTKRLLFLLSLFVTVGIIASVIGLGVYLAGLYPEISIIYIGTAAIPSIVLIFCIIRSLFWIKTGDFPVEIRIFEIEYREELLKKAREFREME